MRNLTKIYRNTRYFLAKCLTGGDKNRIVRASKKFDVERFLQALAPVPIREPLIRIGGDGDGGYLVPDLLDGIEYCFSPGTSFTADFELDLASRDITSFMADYSVDAPPFDNPRFVFEKKYLGSVNDAINMRLDDWVNRNVSHISKDLILQMDIERSEYAVLLDVSEETLGRFRIVVVEFHNFDMAFEVNGLALLNAVFDKLLRQFSPVHIHPNNYSPAEWHFGLEIPPVLEFTFLRNDFVQKDAHPLIFPHPLDRLNNEKKADVVLPEYWWS